MPKLLKILLLLPVIWFGTFFVLRIWMTMTPSTPEETRRYTHARTLASAVCRTDAYTGPDVGLVTQMIDQGEDVNQRVVVEYGKPPQALIAVAAHCGAMEIVPLLISRGANVDDSDLGNQLNDDMARLLIAHGASLDAAWQAQDPRDGTQLIQAAVYWGQGWLIERLIPEHADMQLVNGKRRGLVAMLLAGGLRDQCHTRCIALLRQLLAAQAHVNPRSADEQPPLLWAARDGNAEALQLLLDAGAKVDASMPAAAMFSPLPYGSRSDSRVNAVLAAAYECNVDAVRLLLDAGAPVPTSGVGGSELRANIDICNEAWLRASDVPKRTQILELLDAARGKTPAAVPSRTAPPTQ